MSRPPVRIAWVSPLPPIPSGIGDYSFELLPMVAARAPVEVVSPTPRGRRLRVPDGVTVRRPSALPALARRADVLVHHLGNNPHHEYVYRAALRWPGVAVLHDFVQHHLAYHAFIENSRNDWSGYERALRDAYGPVGARIAALRAHGMATDFEKFLFPLNEHLVRRALAVVVHSHEVRERILESVPGARVFVIPHHAGAPPATVAGVGRDEARARLGLPREAFLVGQFGFITKPKRPAAVLGGFARLLAHRPDAQLVVVGENQTPGYALSELIGHLGIARSVRLTGFVDLERFYLWLKAVDAVVNLRYPTAGEASGTIARALAEGRAVVVSDVGSFAELPDEVACKVEVDGDEPAQVAAHLIRLAGDGAFRAGLEERARRYASSVMDPERCADLYVEVARAVAERDAPARRLSPADA